MRLVRLQHEDSISVWSKTNNKKVKHFLFRFHHLIVVKFQARCIFEIMIEIYCYFRESGNHQCNISLLSNILVARFENLELSLVFTFLFVQINVHGFENLRELLMALPFLYFNCFLEFEVHFSFFLQSLKWAGRKVSITLLFIWAPYLAQKLCSI